MSVVQTLSPSLRGVPSAPWQSRAAYAGAGADGPGLPRREGAPRNDGAGRRIVIAAGGTGGHFFPAEALAAELLARGHAIALLTDARSNGARNPVFAPHPAHVLKGAGIAGRGPIKAARSAIALAQGVFQARSVLRGLHPSVIVGFGGYPTVAPALARTLFRRRIPLVLHEQNAVLGRANRALAPYAARLALGFEATTRVPARVRAVFTGNPVRPAIVAAAAPYAPPTDAIRLVIVGGSLGASILSAVVPAALAALPAKLRARLAVTQQCRPADLDAVRAAYSAASIAATLATFFTDIAPLLAAAHLVIARAGASTCAELAVLGRPAILVPLPTAIDGHQAANAAALGATTIAQPDFTQAALTARLAALLTDPPELARQAAAIAGHARPDAAAALADLVESVIAHGSATRRGQPTDRATPPVYAGLGALPPVGGAGVKPPPFLAFPDPPP